MVAKKQGDMYPTNRKGMWVIVTRGEKKAFIAQGSSRDAAAKKFFASRNMRMVKVQRKK